MLITINIPVNMLITTGVAQSLLELDEGVVCRVASCRCASPSRAATGPATAPPFLATAAGAAGCSVAVLVACGEAGCHCASPWRAATEPATAPPFIATVAGAAGCLVAVLVAFVAAFGFGFLVLAVCGALSLLSALPAAKQRQEKRLNPIMSTANLRLLVGVNSWCG